MRRSVNQLLGSTLLVTLLMSASSTSVGQQSGFGQSFPSQSNYGPEQSVWAATFRQAQRQAAERRRLVLIHFWDDNCAPCRTVERNVFSLPEVERALSVNYVPVRVNVSDEPELAQHYKVTRWPTDVVVTPEGIEIFRSTSEQDPNRYIAFLDRVATHARVGTTVPPGGVGDRGPTNETTTVANSARDDQGFVPRNYEDRLIAGRDNADPQRPAGYAPPDDRRTMSPNDQNFRSDGGFNAGGGDGRSPYSAVSELDRRQSQAQNRWQVPPMESRTRNSEPQDNPYNSREAGAGGNLAANPGSSSSNPQFAAGSVESPSPPLANTWASNTPNGADPRTAALPGRTPVARPNPTIALDGFCPVTLTEQKKWRKADAKFGAIHRDRTYLFAGPQEQQRFLANPDRYSPMLSGFDPVRYAEQGQLVEGKRNHGLTIGDQMYLFTDEASLEQFWKQPQTYIRVVQEAMRAPPGGNVNR